jgi:hypothetical protein
MGRKAREGRLLDYLENLLIGRKLKDETKRRDGRVCKTICKNLSIVSNYFANNLVC